LDDRVDRQEMPEEVREFLVRKRRQRNRWVALAVAIGLSLFGLMVVLCTRYSLYREHHEFRRVVRPGMSDEDVVARFGEPYRTYWTRQALEPVLAGRGAYTRFDRDPAEPGSVPARFLKVLHYRPTPEHGEFVFIGADGRVVQVLTDRP